MRTRLPGTYVLVMHLPRMAEVQVGALGRVRLPAGYYLYVGSALGGLWQRLERHLASSKRRHWHIDYLLEVMAIVEIWYREGNERFECAWAQAFTASEHLEPVDGIGASDCACRTHLFRSEKPPQAGWFTGESAFAGVQSWIPPGVPHRHGIINAKG